MAGYVIRGLGVIAAAGVFMLSAAPPAGATTTLGPCMITALKPTPVAFRFNGTKVASGQASVRCSPPRQVWLQLFLYGDDLVFDEVVDHWTPRQTFGPTTVTLGEAPTGPDTPFHYTRGCDEDIGADELYTRVRARFYTGIAPNLVFSAWSAWDRGPTVTYSC
jgi:hypothetical protein